MPAYYTYFLSSLPTLQFQNEAPFSYSRFAQLCSGLVSEKDLAIIKQLPKLGLEKKKTLNEALKKWMRFERSLRNELVRLRASRLHKDPMPHLREEAGADDLEITRLSISAYRQPHLLEAEKSLDLERWNKLEELSLGHYFDSEALFIYGLKVLILERWSAVKSADSDKLLKEVLS